MSREPVDMDRLAAERNPTDPHTMGPVDGPREPLGFYSRYCSCGWGLGSPTREQVMAASKRHRAWVSYYRRMRKKEATDG